MKLRKVLDIIREKLVDIIKKETPSSRQEEMWKTPYKVFNSKNHNGRQGIWLQ